jgi:hypothetical protein
LDDIIFAVIGNAQYYCYLFILLNLGLLQIFFNISDYTTSMIEQLMNKWSEAYGSGGGLVEDTIPVLLY